MEKQFSPNDIREFIKTLVTLGDIHYVGADGVIMYSVNDTPVGVAVKEGGKDKQMPIALYREGMTIGDYRLLNPFVEKLGKHDELDWFMNFLMVVPGCLMTKALMTMQELATDEKKDTDNFKAAAALADFIGRIDQKFAKELKKFRPLELGLIYYDKKEHIAQFQSDFFDEEASKNLASSMRKASFELIKEFIAKMLGTDKPHQLYYNASVIGCPKFDAIVHVLVDVLDRIDEYVEPLLGINLHVQELKQHLENLEAYQKAMRFLASSASSARQTEDADKAKKEAKAPKTIAQMVAENSPWSKAAVGASPIKNNFSNAVIDVGGPISGPIQTRFGMTIATPTPVAPIMPPMYGIGATQPTFPGLGGGSPMFPEPTRSSFDLSRAVVPGSGMYVV